jgi:hypothetical protein
VRFLKILGGEEDPHGLVHKVRSCAQLRDMGAEPVGDSCILGDLAYEVQPGFLAEGAALQAAASAKPAAAPARAPAVQPGRAPPATAAAAALPAVRATPSPPETTGPALGRALPRELEERRKEAEALARFLLENLS